MPKKKVAIDDILKLKYLRSVSLSPDETKIMFTVEIAGSDKKKYHSHIYMIDTEGQNFRQFTYGDVNDSGPVFSPDGKWILFVSKRGEKKGIYKMPTSGGEAALLVEGDGSFSEIAISPDSRKFLCVFKKNDDVPKDKNGKKEEPVFRHITRKFYKLDNSGYVPQDQGHIYLYDIETGKGKKIINTKNGERTPVWFADNKRFAYITNIHPDPDEESLRDEIFIASISGGKPRKLDKPAGPAMALTISPDNKEIAYIGHANPNDAWGVTNFHVWKIPISGGKAIDLTPKLDRMTMDMTISDLAESDEIVKPSWSADGKMIYFQMADSGASHLCAVSSKGSPIKTIIGGKLHLAMAAFGMRKRFVVAAIADSMKPAEIFIANLNEKAKPKQLTKLNGDYVKQTKIQTPEELIVKGHDGYPIHAWIIKPPNFTPNRKYPSILEIHGGPRVQYGFTFFYEMQLLAARGYVVYYGNPRGGQGYGEKHAKCIVDGWGTVDYEDCMSLAKYMANQRYIDKKRMGVTGGSYGGYMTNWIVGHTNIFAAAVTQRSVTNIISFFGSSDIGFSFDREISGTFWNNLDRWWEMSPISHVKNIRTPLLISHSENDLRCPIEQGEQLFIALKKLGRKVEMVRFPEEPHGLSRCGRPDRRIARLEWIVRWFDRYLKRK